MDLEDTDDGRDWVLLGLEFGGKSNRCGNVIEKGVLDIRTGLRVGSKKAFGSHEGSRWHFDAGAHMRRVSVVLFT